jgi:hypothetical protein
MTAVSTDLAIGQLLAVIVEAFEGPKQGWSYFTDSGAESGLFGTLAGTSASAASRVWGGTTIAAHAHHIRFSLAASAAWLSGDRAPQKWEESWRVTTVDDAAWRSLQQEIRSGYDALRQAIEANAARDVESIGGTVAAVAHTAYHLGAIRQKVAASRRV